jgi:hypothetical protein
VRGGGQAEAAGAEWAEEEEEEEEEEEGTGHLHKVIFHITIHFFFF